MDDIAAAAGVARSTVYVYFASRSELLVACIEGLYEQLAGSIEHSTEGEPADRLTILFDALLSTIDLQPAFFRLALATQGAPGQAGEAVAKQLSLIGLEMSAMLIDIIDEGTRRGTWSVTAPERVAVLIGQQIYGALAVRAGEADPESSEVAAEELSRFVISGLRA